MQASSKQGNNDTQILLYTPLFLLHTVELLELGRIKLRLGLGRAFVSHVALSIVRSEIRHGRHNRWKRRAAAAAAQCPSGPAPRLVRCFDHARCAKFTVAEFLRIDRSP